MEDCSSQMFQLLLNRTGDNFILVQTLDKSVPEMINYFIFRLPSESLLLGAELSKTIFNYYL